VLRELGLLAVERECQAGDDERQEEDWQDALSGASVADGFAVGGVEGLGSAAISAVADLQGVVSGFDWLSNVSFISTDPTRFPSSTTS
jgi:hypothetical protein